MAEDTDSPLLNLPPELRNNIYELVFTNTTINFNTTATRRPPSLLLSCKQIYTEAVTVYYAEATFVSNEPQKAIIAHIQTLPPKSRKALRNVVLGVSDANQETPCPGCAGTRRTQPIACLGEAVELTNLAVESQTRLFQFQHRLKAHGLTQLSSRARAGILLSYRPEIIHTRTPWQTFRAMFGGQQVDERFCWIVSLFFQREHESPLGCWVKWMDCDDPVGKCGCPLAGDELARGLGEEGAA
ncbi:hypothetical protein PRZ48_014175 [Zasmidium cellare]|uniref:F-box domain-containing protein n=1 Tax=Zasmidium cellare TaxID=395010 RepID=A0ABR0E0E1_ZASCE|nr:hypothetical protein PRZ48_014175 [Zasmidium cellare]